jgi:pantoate--beta-alanine ligase
MNAAKRPDWIADKEEIRRRVVAAQREGKTVGLVPTMGNLHAGHASLIHQARAETDVVVVTIFVNPIQFVQGEDFDKYPRTPQQDQEICGEAGADWIFAPSNEVMYPPGHRTRVQVHGIEEPLCGHHRPGHFVGVATVVSKLLHLVPADLAYFGLKDYQQARLIERLVKDLDFPTQVRLCPTVRESDGLAMSSRNSYLSPDERSQAVVLSESLCKAAGWVREGNREPKSIRQKVLELISSKPLAQVDYVELVDPETFEPATTVDRPTLLALAVRFGRARLIDNCILTP